MNNDTTSISQDENFQNQENQENNNNNINSAAITIDTNDVSWQLAPGVKGIGDKPPEFDDRKYKTVVDQLKAHNELQKYVSQTRKNYVIPEKYNLNLSEEVKGKNITIKEDDEILKSFENFAKENKYTQEHFDSAINFYLNNLITDSSNFDTELQEASEGVLKELGVNSTLDNVQKELKTWLVNNGGLAYENDIHDLLADPLALKILYNLKQNSNNGIPIPSTEASPRKDREYFMAQHRDPRYSVELAYTNKVDKEFEEAVNRGWI